MVICLKRFADLHMAQLMLLPLTVSCFSKIHIGFTFLVPAHLGSPRQRAVKRVCVCVCVCGTLVSVSINWGRVVLKLLIVLLFLDTTFLLHRRTRYRNPFSICANQFFSRPSSVLFSVYVLSKVPSVLWRCWLGSRKDIRPVKNWVVRCWHGYLSGARCRLACAQLMPLPLTVSCFSKIQIGFTYLVPAHPGSPGHRAIKRVCVCVCVLSNLPKLILLKFWESL